MELFERFLAMRVRPIAQSGDAESVRRWHQTRVVQLFSTFHRRDDLIKYCVDGALNVTEVRVRTLRRNSQHKF
jgi:tRNA G37 N-methylase TrmD